MVLPFKMLLFGFNAFVILLFMARLAIFLTPVLGPFKKTKYKSDPTQTVAAL